MATYRGLQVVVINPQSGDVKLAMTFDTSTRGDRFDHFIQKDQPEGYVIAVACLDDCMNNLSEAGKRWFEKMGSKLIRKLGYRRAFAFLGISGRQEAFEKIGYNDVDRVQVTQVFLKNPSKIQMKHITHYQASAHYLSLVSFELKLAIREVLSNEDLLTYLESLEELDKPESRVFKAKHVKAALRESIEYGMDCLFNMKLLTVVQDGKLTHVQVKGAI